MLPVDEVKDGAPGYLTIIKKPMDLSTIENKLKNHVYENCN
jgi:transcription initiation factor TFIID subunit 2